MLEHGFDIAEMKQKFGIADTSKPIGEISSSYVDSQGKMRINARIYVDSPAGVKIWQAVNSGDLRGLSVGYRPQYSKQKTGEVDYKIFDEVSLCKQPFFEGAEVAVTASNFLNSQKEKKNSQLWIELMSEQQQQQTPEITTPASTPVPVPVPDNKDASEILRNADDLAKQIADQQAEIQKLLKEKEQLAALKPLADAEMKRQELERKEREVKRNEMADQLMNMINTTVQGLPENEKGQVSNEALSHINNALRMDNADPVTSVLASVFKANYEAAKEKEQKEKEIAELKSKFAATSDKLKDVTEKSRVTASYQSVMNTTNEQGGEKQEQTGGIENLFVIPSAEVCNAWGMSQQEAQIRASAWKNNPIAPPPVHRYVKSVSGSMRDYDPNTFSFICQKINDFDRVHVDLKTTIHSETPVQHERPY